MLRTSRRVRSRPSFETVTPLEARIVLASPAADVEDESTPQAEANRSGESERDRGNRGGNAEARREARQLRREERRDLAGPTAPSEPDLLEDENDSTDDDLENEDGPAGGVRPQIERAHRDAEIVSVVDPRAFQEPLPASPPEVTTPVEATLPAPPVEVLGFIGDLPVRDEPPAADAPPAFVPPEPPAPPTPIPNAPPVEIPPVENVPRAADILSSVPDVAQIPQFVADRLATLPRPLPPPLLPLPGPLGAMPVEVSGALDDLFEMFFDWFADSKAN